MRKQILLGFVLGVSIAGGAAAAIFAMSDGGDEPERPAILSNTSTPVLAVPQACSSDNIRRFLGDIDAVIAQLDYVLEQADLPGETGDMRTTAFDLVRRATEIGKMTGKIGEINNYGCTEVHKIRGLANEWITREAQIPLCLSYPFFEAAGLTPPPAPPGADCRESSFFSKHVEAKANFFTEHRRLEALSP